MKNGWPRWNQDQANRAADLKRALENADPDHFRQAVNQEILSRISQFITAILAYRRSHDRRQIAEPPTIWQQGGSRLLDYSCNIGDAEKPCMLVVPSLVNRAYVLDLREDRSFLRMLSSSGIRPFLLDWGDPGPKEQNFTLTDYISGRLADALAAIRMLTGGKKPFLLGYCMGGTLAIPLAQSRQADLSGLILMAAPWDFHTLGGNQLKDLAGLLSEPLKTIISMLGEVPVDILQTLFMSLCPLEAAGKYRRLAQQLGSKSHQQSVHSFTILEDWLNDGPSLAGHVALECLEGWYGSNNPARGAWHIGSMSVQPDTIRLPSLAVIPRRDRIVPPQSALPLANALKGCCILRPDLGHIGMVASRRAPEVAWRPIINWIGSQAG